MLIKWMVSKCYFNDVLDQPVATPNMAPAQYYRPVRLKYFSLMTSCDDKYDLTWSQWSYYRMAKFNLLSHPNPTLAPQARQARASGENLNYLTLAPQARPSGEILNYSLSWYSDILSMIIAWSWWEFWTEMTKIIHM